jgi:hypothetical protein
MSTIMVATAFVATNFCFAQNNVPVSVQKELDAEEKKMFDAILKYDPDYWKNKVDGDYITINADGIMQTKTEIMADTARKNMFAGWTYQLFDRKTRLYGDVAIITGRSQYLKDGTPYGEVFHTEIWVKRNGTWIFEGWHGTYTKETQAAMMKPAK